MKATYDKPVANITLNWKKWKPFPIKSGKEAKVSTFPKLLQQSSGI
jgi:hypothetical protein